MEVMEDKREVKRIVNSIYCFNAQRRDWYQDVLKDELIKENHKVQYLSQQFIFLQIIWEYINLL